MILLAEATAATHPGCTEDLILPRSHMELEINPAFCGDPGSTLRVNSACSAPPRWMRLQLY